MSRDAFRRATRFGDYVTEGFEREVEKLTGIRVSGILRHKVLGTTEDSVVIQFEDDWVRPTRS